MVAGDAARQRRRRHGTPYYAAPEQARRARAPLPQSDLYALGATLWELLCGRPPFAGPDAAALLAQHRNAEAEPPSRHAPGDPRPGSTRSCSRCSPSARRTARADAAAVRDALDRLGGAPRVPVAALAARPRAARRARGGAGERCAARSTRRAPGARRRGRDRRRARDRQDPRWSTRPPRRPPRAARPSCAGRADEESRAYGPWRAALRPLVAAASGLPAAVLDDVRRLTGDGRPPEAPAAGERADARRGGRGCGCSTRSRTLARAAARERSGCCVVLEDVHAADRSSLALLGHVVGAVPGRAAARRADLPRRRRRRGPSARPRCSTRSSATAG